MNPQQFKLGAQMMEAERLVEAAKAKVEAAVFTEDSKRIDQAQQEAVEAYREYMDRLVANNQAALAAVKRQQ